MTNINGMGSGYILGGDTVGKADAAKTAQQKLTETVTKASGSTTDAASLSGAGSLLASVATTTDDVRAAKVESLREAINNGTYNVSAGDVADKLLKSMLK